MVMFANQPPYVVYIRTQPAPDCHSRPPQLGGGGGMNLTPKSVVSRRSTVVRKIQKLQSHPQRGRLPTNDCRRTYRLLNWNLFLAPFCPYFLRSFARGSRVTMPSAFSFLRSSALNSMSARVIPRRTASACPATPPPLTRASTLKFAEVSVRASACLALMRCEGVTKYSSNPLPLTLNSPLPGRRKTRAIAAFRRPVP